LRLVVDEELARDRGPQVALQGPRLPQTHVGRAIKEPHGSSAVGLCALESGVRVRHQRRNIATVAGEYGNADARTKLDGMFGDRNLTFDRLAQALRQ
jgi:hypothetical protein